MDILSNVLSDDPVAEGSAQPQSSQGTLLVDRVLDDEAFPYFEIPAGYREVILRTYDLRIVGGFNDEFLIDLWDEVGGNWHQGADYRQGSHGFHSLAAAGYYGASETGQAWSPMLTWTLYEQMNLEAHFFDMRDGNVYTSMRSECTFRTTSGSCPFLQSGCILFDAMDNSRIRFYTPSFYGMSGIVKIFGRN